MAVTKQHVDISLIDVDPHNPRGQVGDVTDLAASLRIRGQEEPVQLIPKDDGRFWLHEGHRRHAAMLQAGIKQAWYIEKTFASERDRLLSQGVMHLHRVDFDPIAWSNYLHRLYWTCKMSRVDIALHLGRSQKWVRDTMALYHLEPEEKQAVSAGRLSKTEALWRLGNRRALRDNTPPPPPPKPGPAREEHLTNSHPLAATVKKRCASSGREHADRLKIGRVGCGACWEAVIRDDAIAAAPRPVLAAA